MLTRIRDKNIWVIYAAIFLLGVAYGVAIALVALHLDARGFGKEDIGTLAAWFASGIVALSIPTGALVRRFGAKWPLAVALLGYALSVTIFPLLGSYGAIAAARFFDGACSVCIWVSCETVLLERAEAHQKAYVTSLYAMAVAIGYVVGPLLAKGIVAVAPMRVAFLVAGILATASGLLVLARLDARAPSPLHGEAAASEADAPALPTTALLWKNKTSCFATFAYGYFQASVVLFLPLYLMESKGIAKEQTILVPAFFAGGMLLFSNAAGRVGDRVGHLLVMRLLAAIGTAMILGFVFLASFPLMCAAVFVAGATLASISPVSLALQGVVTAPRDYSRSNGIYNAFYAAGILLGPPVSSAIFARWGGPSMLYHLAALWGAFVVFSVVFFADDPAAKRAQSEADAVSFEA